MIFGHNFYWYLFHGPWSFSRWMDEWVLFIGFSGWSADFNATLPPFLHLLINYADILFVLYRGLVLCQLLSTVVFFFPC
jgi:hypothetical protein